jgi:uncharacterized iron-regulated protein
MAALRRLTLKEVCCQATIEAQGGRKLRRQKAIRVARRRRTARRRFRPTRARSELIAIQQRIVERLKHEIEDSIGHASPAVGIYYDEYWKELARFERISSKAELMDSCAAADIVYCGDYHTLRQSQATACKIIWELLLRGRDVTVALEMVGSKHQGVLDQYLAGFIDDPAFLKAVDYQNTWDFHWEPYRRLLGLCRREGLRVIAINSEPEDVNNRLIERDFHAAQLIAEASIARPESLVFVLTGDLHVARDHLPLIVDSVLQRRGQQRKRLVVHQNAETIYWKLAEQGLERKADVVQIGPDCYCVFSATPLVKLQSYVNWEQNHRELSRVVRPDTKNRVPVTAGDLDEDDPEEDEDDEPDYSEQLQEIVATIAGFLEIEEKGKLDDFSVYTTGELDFLATLSRDKRFTGREIADIKRQVKSSESYFIPKANIIYLATLTLHTAAEEATHFINSICAGFDEAPREPRDAFYYRAVKEALGFFGSRIIDHKRYCMSFEDFEDFLRANRGRRLDLTAHMTRVIGRLALRHRKAELAWLKRGGTIGAVGGIYRGPAAVVNGVSHALGYVLGDKLYNALVAGVVNKRFIKELFYDRLTPGTAELRYLTLVERLNGVQHGVPAEAERF